MKKTLILSCALALTGMSTAATAAGGQTFLRGEIGNTQIEVDYADFDDTAYAVRGGYFFNANIGVEGFYANYGEDSGPYTSAKLTGFGAGLVAKKNFGANDTGFFIDGRVGLAHTKTEAALMSMLNRYYVKDTAISPYVGVGVGYDFSESFGLSVNCDYLSTEARNQDITATMLTVGGEVRF